MSVRRTSRVALLGALMISAGSLLAAQGASAATPARAETALKHKAQGGKAHTTARHKALKHHAAAAKASARAKAKAHHGAKAHARLSKAKARSAKA